MQWTQKLIFHVWMVVCCFVVPNLAFAHPGHGLSEGVGHGLLHALEIVLFVVVVGLVYRVAVHMKRRHTKAKK